MSQQDVPMGGEDPAMEKAWDRVERWLSKRNRNAQWLADRLNYSKQRVSNWKKRDIPKSEFPAIAAELGETTDWLAGLAPAKSLDSDRLSPMARKLAQEFDTISDPEKTLEAFARILSVIDRMREP